MPVERFFVDSSFKQGDNLIVEGAELHHLAHVIRLKVGEQAEVVNGRGDLASARITSLTTRQAELEVLTLTHTPPPEPELILAQAIPRINRLDFIIEKGTELGMSSIWLFPGKLSERKELMAHQLTRLCAIAIAAMKQCGRLYLPEIILKPELSQWKPLSQKAFFGDLEATAHSFGERWKKDEVAQGILCFIGPESGFTPEEIVYLKQLHVQGVNFHPYTLRTDTAALCALSLISHRLWSPKF